MDTEQARFNMIEQQIRPWEVLDPAVLSLLALVKREDFVPTAHRALAFMDTEIPLPEGQLMLAPKIEARMLQELAVHKHENVLVIGANAIYLTALLSHKAQKVTVLDCHTEVIDLAKKLMTRAGLVNVQFQTVRAGELASGQPADAPFDAILLAGSVASVPQKLFDQIKVDTGRLLAIVGQEPVMCATLYRRGQSGPAKGTPLFETVALPLAGFEQPSRFQF